MLRESESAREFGQSVFRQRNRKCKGPGVAFKRKAEAVSRIGAGVPGGQQRNWDRSAGAASCIFFQ